MKALDYRRVIVECFSSLCNKIKKIDEERMRCAMPKPTKPRKTDNDNPLFISRVAALLDFYSDRATAHASLFVASIFGLVTVLAIIQAFILSNNQFDRWIIWGSEFLFFIFTYVGHYTLNQFSYYANISQRLTAGLEQKKSFLGIPVDAKEENLDQYFDRLERNQRLILIPKMLVKKLGTFGGFFLAIIYWIIVFFLGLIVYFPFFISLIEIIEWVSIFLTLFIVIVVLPVIAMFIVDRNGSQEQIPNSK